MNAQKLEHIAKRLRKLAQELEPAQFQPTDIPVDDFEKAIQSAKKLFGISGTVSDEDLKKKYRRLMIQWHPDKGHAKAEEMSRNVQQAYAVLKHLKDMPTFDHLDEDLDENF